MAVRSRKLEERPPAPSETSSVPVNWPEAMAASRLEVVRESLRLPAGRYRLLVDSTQVGDLEWVNGRYPELHLQAGKHSAFVRLKRLRPLVLSGRMEGPGGGSVDILHVGSAGQGLVEIGGAQFVRRTSPTGKMEVRDHEGAVVLTSSRASGKRILAYERATSILQLPALLELTVVEAFCAIYTGRHTLRVMLAGWVRIPPLGRSLGMHPKVRGLLH